MLFKEIIIIYSWDSYEAHKYTQRAKCKIIIKAPVFEELPGLQLYVLRNIYFNKEVLDYFYSNSHMQLLVL
jgi:hypothetical protein